MSHPLVGEVCHSGPESWFAMCPFVTYWHQLGADRVRYLDPHSQEGFFSVQYVPTYSTAKFSNALASPLGAFMDPEHMFFNHRTIFCVKPTDASILAWFGREMNPNFHCFMLYFIGGVLIKITVVYAVSDVWGEWSDEYFTFMSASFLMRVCCCAKRCQTRERPFCAHSNSYSVIGKLIDRYFEQVMMPKRRYTIQCNDSDLHVVLRSLNYRLWLEGGGEGTPIACNVFVPVDEYHVFTRLLTQRDHIDFVSDVDAVGVGWGGVLTWQVDAIFRWPFLLNKLVGICQVLCRLVPSYVVVWVYEYFKFVMLTPLYIRVNSTEKIYASIKKAIRARGRKYEEFEFAY